MSQRRSESYGAKKRGALIGKLCLVYNFSYHFRNEIWLNWLVRKLLQTLKIYGLYKLFSCTTKHLEINDIYLALLKLMTMVKNLEINYIYFALLKLMTMWITKATKNQYFNSVPNILNEVLLVYCILWKQINILTLRC